MKLAFFVAVVAVSLVGAGVPLRGQTPGTAAPAAAPVAAGELEAEVIRPTTARQIDASGFATKPFPVNKGAKFAVVSQELADVILQKRGIKIRLAKADVRIYTKDPNAPAPAAVTRDPAMYDPRAREAAAAETARAAEAAAVASFVPGGQLIVLSAKYSLPGNQPRNVKSKVEKLIPKGTLTAPVRILVSDELSRAAANQPAYTVITSETSTTVVQAQKNMLTVTFSYNGQTLTKQGLEGTTLILP